MNQKWFYPVLIVSTLASAAARLDFDFTPARTTSATGIHGVRHGEGEVPRKGFW